MGLTEAQAKEKGFQVKVGKFPFVGNSKATILDAHDGFIKVVTDAKYGEILGVHIIGPYATEIIAEAVTALELEATVEEMMFTIHAHPTVAEALLDGILERRRQSGERVAVHLQRRVRWELTYNRHHFLRSRKLMRDVVLEGSKFYGPTTFTIRSLRPSAPRSGTGVTSMH